MKEGAIWEGSQALGPGRRGQKIHLPEEGRVFMGGRH
jgi:hypothetical protein